MANLAGAITVSMATHARKLSDVYPTPPSGTVAVIPRLLLPQRAKIVEPCCGDGAMARVLHAHGFDVIASDIRRTGYGTPYVDYLQTASPEADALVTNPPFSLAERFIRKAVPRYPLVALLLKSNFWHTAGRLALWDAHPPTDEAKLTWRLAFLEDERGSSPLMDCTWWIWRRGDSPLPRPLPKPPGVEKLLPMLSVAMVQLEDVFEVAAEVRGGKA